MSKSVVITGSTRGIGLGLARNFLARNCQVMVHGRTPESVEHAMSLLGAMAKPGNIAGFHGYVSDYETMQALWQAAKTRFGHVDIWINNAGLGHNLLPIWEIPLERMTAVINANITGLVIASRVAFQGMQDQGNGQLYNMHGFGSDGRTRSGMSIYGMSKAAVNYFSDSLIAETAGTAVKVGTLSPGMVLTDLFLDPLVADPATLVRSRRIFNILADRVETVTPWLVDQIMANHQHGKAITWLTRRKIIWRFVTAPFNKRDLFAA